MIGTRLPTASKIENSRRTFNRSAIRALRVDQSFGVRVRKSLLQINQLTLATNIYLITTPTSCIGRRPNKAVRHNLPPGNKTQRQAKPNRTNADPPMQEIFEHDLRRIPSLSSFPLFISRGIDYMLILTGAPLRWLAEGYHLFHHNGFPSVPGFADQTFQASSVFPLHFMAVTMLPSRCVGAVDGGLQDWNEKNKMRF